MLVKFHEERNWKGNANALVSNGTKAVHFFGGGGGGGGEAVVRVPDPSTVIVKREFRKERIHD